MNFVVKIVIATGAAAAAWAALHFVPAIPLPLGLLIATIATVVLTSLPGRSADASTGSSNMPAAPAASGPREEGEVKWFNVTKGFGFITKDDGDEIFVHFRSIRGEGRRGLRDGQRVSFVESQTDKGPQAEDVEAL